MADRRMLAKTITENDNFVALPATAQALYMHLTLSADDDGFCNQISTAMFRAHAKQKDLDALVKARYILRFENGVMVLKHWRMANTIRKDRYTPTVYQEEYAQLILKKNLAYTMATERVPSGNHSATMATTWQPDGNQPQPQYRLGKDRLGKVRLEEDITGGSTLNAHVREEEPEPVNDLGRVMTFYMDKINPSPSTTCVDLLKNYTEILGGDVVLHALGISLDERKTGWSYIQAILSRYEREGLTSMDAVLQAEAEFTAKKEGKKAGSGTSNLFLQIIEEGKTNDTR